MAVFALPVSLEQVAALLKRMGPEDRRRLLRLVPELLQDAAHITIRTPTQMQETVQQLQNELMQTIQGRIIDREEPFIDDLTLEAYLQLPDSERARLWEEWADMDLDDLEEQELRPDAVPAG